MEVVIGRLYLHWLLMLTIDFHFDFLSPYAYLAWMRLGALAASTGARVQPRPTLLAALLAHGNTRGPAEVPARRRYVLIDTLRSARHAGLPLVPPPAHPFNPLLALRSVMTQTGEAQAQLITALYRQTWGGGPGCESATDITLACQSVGLDAQAVLSAASTPEIKSQLRAATEEAIAHGVFGVPTMRVGPEAGDFFFGFDSFGALERRLRGEIEVTNVELTKWDQLPASARRVL